jgi:transcriptional regulator with XRE-family HTH domain
MKNRLKTIRESLGLNQKEFGKRINVAQSTLAMFETGQRILKDIHISQICNEFNVSEKWLRDGIGEIFVPTSSLTLDEYAKKHKLTDLETEIIKNYMELDSDTRKSLMEFLQKTFGKHSETVATKEIDIEVELENYRLELEAEQKEPISSVSEKQKGIVG